MKIVQKTCLFKKSCYLCRNKIIEIIEIIEIIDSRIHMIL